jgi:hypothetical protein
MYVALNLGGLIIQLTMGAQVVIPGLLFENTATPLIGASAGVFGVLMAGAFLAPNATVLLFFIIPMKLRTLAYALVALAVLTIFFGGNNAGGEAGHLGRRRGVLEQEPRDDDLRAHRELDDQPAEVERHVHERAEERGAARPAAGGPVAGGPVAGRGRPHPGQGARQGAREPRRSREADPPRRVGPRPVTPPASRRYAWRR